nr:MAG TPA: hypothetical protein [Caudoviricetes sp.]
MKNGENSHLKPGKHLYSQDGEKKKSKSMQG